MLTLSKPLSWVEAWRYYREELRNARLNYYLPIVSSWHGLLARHWGLNKYKRWGDEARRRYAALLVTAT
jgi:hypothetical protein